MKQYGFPLDLSVQPELTQIGEGSSPDRTFVVIGVIPNQQGEWDFPTAYVLYDAYLQGVSDEQLQMYGGGSTKLWLTPGDATTAQT